MEMGVLKTAYDARERQRERARAWVVFQSSAVLASHPSALTRHGCMLLSLNSQLLLGAISVHLKFSSQALLFPFAAVSLQHPITQNQAWLTVLGCRNEWLPPKARRQYSRVETSGDIRGFDS